MFTVTATIPLKMTKNVLSSFSFNSKLHFPFVTFYLIGSKLTFLLLPKKTYTFHFLGSFETPTGVVYWVNRRKCFFAISLVTSFRGSKRPQKVVGMLKTASCDLFSCTTFYSYFWSFLMGYWWTIFILEIIRRISLSHRFSTMLYK